MQDIVEKQRRAALWNLYRRAMISTLVEVLRDRGHEIGDSRDNDQFEIQMLDFLIHLVEHNDGSRPRIPKLMRQFVFRIGGIARYDDSARPQNTEVPDDGLGRIRKAQRDAI